MMAMSTKKPSTIRPMYIDQRKAVKKAIADMHDVVAAHEAGTLKRKPGRPPLPDDQRHTARIEIRMTEAQREKLEQLGGAAWLRTRIDKARMP